ncbi:MAG: 6-bladed beta-propeller [Balneolales bacterium]|nr:6-bladed beta-propeller [Balneolales bacterium]
MTAFLRFSLFAISIFLLSCTSGAGDKNTGADADASGLFSSGMPDEPEITTKHLLDITDSDEVMFSQVSNIRITSSGDILILDAGASKAHLFSADGSYLGSGIGEGEGPGEGRFLSGIMDLSQNDELLVFSQGLRRFSIYSIQNGAIQPVKDVTVSRFPSSFSLLPDGNIVMLERASSGVDTSDKERVSQINRDGEIIRDAYITFPESETISVTNPDGMMMFTFMTPHSRATQFAFHENTMIKIIQTELGFTQYDLQTGDIISEVRFSTPEKTVSENEKREFLNNMMGGIDMSSSQLNDILSQIPDVRGKVSAVRYDQPSRYVWLQLTPPSQDELNTVWIALTPDGSFKGKLCMEENSRILYIYNGKIYALISPEDEMPFVRVYETIMG